MTARLQPAGRDSKLDVGRSQWLLTRSLPLIAAALVSLTGCMPTGEAPDVTPEFADETSETSERTPVDATREALRSGAYATPEEVGGFCVDGVGVLLTAVDDAAELTLYVVAPAKSATFNAPALHLTTLEGDHSKTEIAEFEDVTLEAGQSHVFRREAGGPLMDAFAAFGGE
jgi:hypothetical protein